MMPVHAQQLPYPHGTLLTLLLYTCTGMYKSYVISFIIYNSKYDITYAWGLIGTWYD